MGMVQIGKIRFYDKPLVKIVSSVGSLTPSKRTGIRLIAVKLSIALWSLLNMVLSSTAKRLNVDGDGKSI